MVSAVLTERRHSQGFIVSESPGEFSRGQVNILQQSGNFQSSSSPILPAGLILGQTTTGLTGAYAATGGNTGTFTCGAVVLSQGVLQGVYTIEFLAATVFNVMNPLGDLVAEGHTGVAFSVGGVGFTITAGGTAAVAGDSATITIAANANVNLYAPLSLSALDGTQIPAAILLNETDASAGNRAIAVLNRDAEVNGSELIYPAGATANQIAAINALIMSGSGMNLVIR
jgi:Bacteriophage lambda head decoration protein D